MRAQLIHSANPWSSSSGSLLVTTLGSTIPTVRRHLYLVLASWAVSYAGSVTSVSISDDKGCYDDSIVGTISATSVGFPLPSCPDGSYAAGGTGSASAYLTSLSVTGVGGDTTQNPRIPFDLSFVTSTASSTRWVVVNGTGSGDLDFTITSTGAALSDTGLASSTILFAGDTFSPCTVGFGSTSCDGTYFVVIPITYGVPFDLSFSITGNVEAGASLNASASYSLTSGQDMVDVPEPNTAWIIVFALVSLRSAVGARVRNIAQGGRPCFPVSYFSS